jgi:hypothetical protein
MRRIPVLISSQYPRVLAGPSSRAVYDMDCFRSLGRWDRGFESHLRHGSFVCVCVVLCLGRGLKTSWSLVQGVLPSVKYDYGTEYEARTLNGLEDPLKNIPVLLQIPSRVGAIQILISVTQSFTMYRQYNCVFHSIMVKGKANPVTGGGGIRV